MDELGSETAAAVFFCFPETGVGETARSLPFAFEKRVGVSVFGALSLGAASLVFGFGASTILAFFLRLGLRAVEEPERADMIERVKDRVLKFSQRGNGGCLAVLGSKALGQ